MKELKENGGIPRSMLLMMAVIAGFTVANCYYNQPLLELISNDLHVSHTDANLITVVTQIGYALGLCFIIPMGDLYSRRRIIIINMVTAAVMAVVIALSKVVWTVWMASLFIGACSVIPQLFIPMAGQYSKPQDKSRNMGFVLSGLLTGILASRVVSGVVGELFGWRAMFFVAAVLMVMCMVITLRMLPDTKKNFTGTYAGLMRSVWDIVLSHSQIRTNAVRAAFGFGSMLAIWSCMAFHLALPPFCAGSDMVGLLGACGIAGALAASGMGKLIPRYGIQRFSVFGALTQLLAWAVAYFFCDSYVALIAAIILVDIGLQCQQLSNQSGCIQEIPAYRSFCRIFKTTCMSIGQIAGWNFAF